MLAKQGRIFVRSVISMCVFIGILLGFSFGFAEEPFPSKPITVIVAWPPGGATDINARSWTDEASKLFGQPVVVVNKGGGGGSIGVAEAMNARADGYTLLNAVAISIIQTALLPGAPWKIEDVQAILGHGVYRIAMVVQHDAPWKNFRDWVNYVKKNPKFKVGNANMIGVNAVLMEWIARREGISIVHLPFIGDAAGVNALLGGHIEMFGATAGHGPFVAAGKLRVLLQLGGDRQPGVDYISDLYPDAPAAIANSHTAIFGPKGIPEPVLNKLHDVLRKACSTPHFMKANEMIYVKNDYQSREDLSRYLIEGGKIYEKLLKEYKLK